MELTADDVIERNLFRKAVYDIIPEGATRILDFGCNEGELLLRLKRDKGCSELYGVELRQNCQPALETFLDGNWSINLEEEDACLGEEFFGFFNYIVLHDVIEHLYDPWYVMAKLWRYLADDVKVIIVTPNFQFWGFWSMVYGGHFRYGLGGGLMNEEHIRWFTNKSLMELLLLSGYTLLQRKLFYPDATDMSLLDKSEPIYDFSVPPKEVAKSEAFAGVAKVDLKFHYDIRDDYEFFLANKLLFVAGKSKEEPKLERVEFGSLVKRRQELFK